MWCKYSALVAMVLALAACTRASTTVESVPAPAAAAPAPAPVNAAADEEAVLKQRVAAFWAARVARDFGAQWELLEPRVKGRVSAEEYRDGRGAVRYVAYQVEDASIQGAFATVKVRVLAQPTGSALVGRRIATRAVLVEDPWIRVGGAWYRRLEADESTRTPPAGQ